MPVGPLVRINPTQWDLEAQQVWSSSRLADFEDTKPLYETTFLNCMCPEVGGVEDSSENITKTQAVPPNSYEEQCANATVLWNRIGSSSRDAEVYRTTTTYEYPRGSGTMVVLQTAVKVLAIVDAKSDEKNNNEIRIARMASGLVEDGISPYFLLVYGARSCNNMWFSSASKIGRVAYKHAIRMYLQSHVPAAQRNLGSNLVSRYEDRLPELTRVFVSREWVEPWVLRLVENLEMGGIPVTGVEIEDSITIPGYILVSELAYGDLGVAALHGRLDAAQWHALIADVFYAISDLQEHLSVVHGDLHVGNILVAISEDPGNPEDRALLPIIHDFGRSYVVGVWRPELRVTDAHEFTKSLVFTLGGMLPPAITTVIDTLNVELAAISQLGTQAMPTIIERWRELEEPSSLL